MATKIVFFITILAHYRLGEFAFSRSFWNKIKLNGIFGHPLCINLLSWNTF